jgi:hypothetical protein
MTLIKQESHLLTCDSCGYEMQIDGELKLPINWVFTVSISGDKDFCPDCFIRDEDGKLIIKKKEDNNE